MRTILVLTFIFIIGQVSLLAQQVVFDIPIFAYHRFGDERYPSTNISDGVFEQQLKYLKENNFKVLTLGEAINLWEAGNEFPEKAVILSIDDGYLSFYTHGWPLLKKYNFHASIFIQTETVGGGDFMSWNQIREIQKAGIEIGNHSAAHSYFVNLPKDKRKKVFLKDLLASQEQFKNRLGFVPEHYAYPYGESTKGMEEILRQEGVIAATVQQSGVFSESSDPFAIPRFPMGGVFATLEGFKNKASMKALRVLKTNPETPFFSENPPSLKVEILPGSIDMEKIQFFVQGDKMEISEINLKADPPYVILKSQKRLTGRRSLYTITAPSKDGQSWHWYSYLWVIPK